MQLKLPLTPLLITHYSPHHTLSFEEIEAHYEKVFLLFVCWEAGARGSNSAGCVCANIINLDMKIEMCDIVSALPRVFREVIPLAVSVGNATLNNSS